MITRILAVVAACAPLASGAATTSSTQPDAMSLVRDVRASEGWLDRIDGLRVRFEGTGETLELMFDRRRLRSDWDLHDRQYIKVWDGQRGISHTRMKTAGRESYGLVATPFNFGRTFMSHLQWGRTAAHPSFWWREPKERNEPGTGAWPEDFALTGTAKYQEVDCYVIEQNAGFESWYVGMQDHRLYGLSNRATPRDAITDVNHALIAAAAKMGKQITGWQQWDEWRKSMPPEKQKELDHAYYRALIPISRPYMEQWMRDYREIQPGCWFPMTQGYHINDIDQPGDKAPAADRVLTAVEVTINPKLADSMFTIEMNEGADVFDDTHDPWLSYKYKKSFTKEEWQAILDTASKRDADEKAREREANAVIGKPAPEFPQMCWLNSPPLTWTALKGKVVLVEFWSESCGPCKNDLPELTRLHRMREESGIVVVSIHTAGSTLEEIEKAIKANGIEYPVSIDVPGAGQPSWGALADAYANSELPHTYVIDRDGNIAGHGALGQAASLARSLAASPATKP